jgi:hypothetical protein
VFVAAFTAALGGGVSSNMVAKKYNSSKKDSLVLNALFYLERSRGLSICME